MATRNTLAALGPIKWIANERHEASNKENSCLEDFAFAARGEFEWLNEYMTGAFAYKENTDMIDLMKTPGGRLKNKTPRNARRSTRKARQDDNDVFVQGRSSIANNTIHHSMISSAMSSPFEDLPQTMALMGTERESTRISQPPDLIRDSPLRSSLLNQTIEQPTPFKSSTKKAIPVSPEISKDEEADDEEEIQAALDDATKNTCRSFSAASRNSFHSAQEGLADNVASAAPEPTTPATAALSSRTTRSSAKRKTSADEPEDHREAKARRSSSPAQEFETAIPSRLNVICSHTPQVSPIPAITTEVTKDTAILLTPLADYGQNSAPVTPVSPIAQGTRQTSVSSDVFEKGPDEPETPSEAPTPMPEIVRSSMNFASLPARETMTHKKSIAGRSSRTSHLESRNSRGTWSMSGGKSLGTMRTSINSADGEEDHEQETELKNLGDDLVSQDKEEDDLDTQLRLAAINKKTVSRLGEKTSTQRLNEKISQLSQQCVLRPNRSIPASGFPGFSVVPGEKDALERPESSRRTTSDPQGQLSTVTPLDDNDTSDEEEEKEEEDDWIPSKPQFPKGTPTRKVALKATIGDTSIDTPSKRSASLSKTSTFLLKASAPPASLSQPSRAPVLATSPTRLPKLVTRSPSKQQPRSRSPSKEQHHAPVNYPKLPSMEISSITTPGAVTSSDVAAASPNRPFTDALSAVKSKQTNLFARARQMLFNKKLDSPKPVVISPKLAPEKFQPFIQTKSVASINEVMAEHAAVLERQMQEADQPLYPDLESPLNVNTGTEKTRSMKLIEDLQKTQFSPAISRLSADNRAPMQINNTMTPPDLATDIFGKGLQGTNGLHTTDKENLLEAPKSDKNGHATRPQNILSVRNTNNDDDNKKPVDTSVNIASKDREWDSPEPDLGNSSDFESTGEETTRTASKLPKPTPGGTLPRLKPQTSSSSLSSKSKDMKKPVRGPPAKPMDSSVSKSKPGPMNIRLGTASQREMDQRKGVPASSSTLLSAMAETFGNSTTIIREPAITKNIPTANSSQNLRAPKSIAALNAAAKAKRDQEERDRKRTEIDKRRQEINQKKDEDRRQAAVSRARKPLEKALEEEKKKKQPLSNRTGLASSAAPTARLNTVSNLKKALEDSVNASKAVTELKKQPKRPYPAEQEEQQQLEQQPISRLDHVIKSSQAGPPPPDAKRRKTEDKADVPENVPVPPVRQSNIRKDGFVGVKPGLFSQLYTPAPAQTQNKAGANSMVKTTLQQQTITKSQQMPQVDAVKFSQDKIKFAIQTPAPSKNAKERDAALSKPSPVYQNGETIELPDIQTDSEDEYEPNQPFNLPSWADSPELRAQLARQQAMDPEVVFGPIGPLSMEDIFKGRGDRTQARFRNRTSSANWSGADRLTREEVETDNKERERMIQNGGWVYQKP